MKRLLTSLVISIGITSPFVTILSAQTHTAVAEIPFAFVVDNQTMPAGKYNVSEISPGSPVFRLADPDRHAIMAQFGSPTASKSANPSLTFACYGNKRILAKVTPPDSEVSYSLSQESIDRRLTHKLGVASMISIKLH